MEFLEACRKLISIDSTPTTGSEEVMESAAELCREAGLEVVFQESVKRGLPQKNLIARFPGQHAEEEVLFISHLDTVDPGNYSLWTETDSNPFNATIRENALFGLGSADCKSDFICKLEAIKQFKGVDFRCPPVLVGTYGEELGLLGARQLTREKTIKARYALIGAPSNMGVVRACNGLVSLELSVPFSEEEKKAMADHYQRESTSSHCRIFRGVAAHSSRPEGGDNAIMKLIRYLDELPSGTLILSVDGGTAFNIVPDQAALEVDLSVSVKKSIKENLTRIVKETENIAADFVMYEDTDFDPSFPTYNLGLIRTDSKGIHLTVTIRTNPKANEETLKGWQQRLSRICEEVGAESHLLQFLPPVRTMDDSRIVQESVAALSEMDLNTKLGAVSATNEMSVLQYRGLETMVIGPGLGVGNSHQANEKVDVEQLRLATEFYKKMIERLCL